MDWRFFWPELFWDFPRFYLVMHVHLNQIEGFDVCFNSWWLVSFLIFLSTNYLICFGKIKIRGCFHLQHHNLCIQVYNVTSHTLKNKTVWNTSFRYGHTIFLFMSMRICSRIGKYAAFHFIIFGLYNLINCLIQW